MKSLTNIEKSAFRRGEYVGYCQGAWRIRRSSDYWVAIRQSDGATKTEKTLDSLNRFFQLNNQ